MALLVVLLGTGALTVKARTGSSVSAECLTRPLIVACGVLLTVPLGFLAGQLVHPKLFDGPVMALAAGRALFEGLNPYELPIDHKALEITGNPALAGYKYGPLMALG